MHVRIWCYQSIIMLYYVNQFNFVLGLCILFVFDRYLLVYPFVYKFLFDKPVLCTVIDDCNFIFHESYTSFSFTWGSNKKLPK